MDTERAHYQIFFLAMIAMRKLLNRILFHMYRRGRPQKVVPPRAGRLTYELAVQVQVPHADLVRLQALTSKPPSSRPRAPSPANSIGSSKNGGFGFPAGSSFPIAPKTWTRTSPPSVLATFERWATDSGAISCHGTTPRRVSSTGSTCSTPCTGDPRKPCRNMRFRERRRRCVQACRLFCTVACCRNPCLCFYTQ